MTCHRGSVTKKRPVPRQGQRKTPKLAVQTSSKAIGTMDNDERRGRRPMTVFPESATPADIASVTAGSSWPAGFRGSQALLLSLRRNADQRKPLPHANFVATIHHGIPADLHRPSFEQGSYLAFLGRISPAKRPDRAIRIARAAGIPLKIAAKVDKVDNDYFRDDILRDTFPLAPGGGPALVIQETSNKLSKIPHPGSKPRGFKRDDPRSRPQEYRALLCCDDA
jgi:hypothetical protein